jgi:hypothetical protein
MAKRKPAFGGLSMSDGDLLEAALIGLERQRDSIMEKMAALRARLGIRGGGRASSAADTVSLDGAAPARKRRRRMSAAGRRRIAAAQRKRWAALKQGPAVKSAPAKKKRRISAAGRARIVAATKKRWAAFHVKKRAAGKKKSAA